MKLHLFHDWGRWVDRSTIALKQYSDEYGEMLANPITKSIWLLQERECAVCGKKQARRVVR